jgi:hypothetical protein
MASVDPGRQLPHFLQALVFVGHVELLIISILRPFTAPSRRREWIGVPIEANRVRATYTLYRAILRLSHTAGALQ